MRETATRTAAPSAGGVAADVTEGVGRITFSHPKGNSLPGALLHRLAHEIVEIGSRADVRVVVLSSDGTGPFCAGASFDELRAITDDVEGREFFMGFARVVIALIRCPRLVVARVHGKVVGGGVGLVAASDYAIAAPTASLRLSELAVGIGPFVVGPVIERKIGRGAFQSLAVDSDWRDAAWGERHGLFARVVDDAASLDAAVDEAARRLARSNPVASARLKEVFWEGTGDWDELLKRRAALSGHLVLSDYTRQALAAFETGR